MSEGAEEAKRQREQLERYLDWVNSENGIEGPSHLSTFFKPHQQERLNWLRKNCVGKIMEIGCNYGFVLAYCGGHIGLDWNEKSIQLAKILSPEKEFYVGDIRNIPLQDKSIDTVMACDCLEHLAWEDVPKAVDEFKRIARKRILITLPDGNKDTPEAKSFKHQWLAVSERINRIEDMLKPWRSITTRTDFFVLVRSVP